MAQAVAGTRPQPGAKKRSAHQRIRDSKAAVQPAPKPEASNGHQVVTTHEKEARHNGVRIRLWKKGSRENPEKFTLVYLVTVAGLVGDWRALRGRFESAAAAKKAALAAGFKVIE